MRLCSDQWLILAPQSVRSLADRRNGLEFLLGCSREVLALEACGDVLLLDDRLNLGLRLGWLGRRNGGDRSSTSALDHLLCLVGVIANILLGGLGSASDVLAGKLLDLFALLVGNICGLSEVLVDDLLVRLVDKGSEE